MKVKPGGALLMCLTVLVWVPASPARAQIKYSDSNYTSMAEAGSSIPPGTAITLQNWQQYKGFMPQSMIAAFSQHYGWKIGSDPKFTMNVGSTVSIPMFSKLQENTEKYAGQARLRKVNSGGYTLDGYVAGVPFPKPEGALAPYELMYNVWTYYFPSITYFDDGSCQIDRFRNKTYNLVDVDQWRMSHASDQGYPANPSYGKGLMQANRFFLRGPEQVKYTTQLAHLPDDPDKVQEIYVFLPSLRRSLRLSSAARCSPILGSDWSQDDNGDGVFFQPTNFSVKLLGVKKVIAMMHGDKAHFYGGEYGGGCAGIAGSGDKQYDRDGMPGWPSPLIGKWEVRDAYVLDVVPLPVMGNYCYGHKVIFADKETFVQLYFDMYDMQDRFYKSELIWYRPIPVNDHESYIVHAHNPEVMIDWQNTHATTSLLNQEPVLNGLNHREITTHPEVYAQPSGMSNIMQ